MSAQFAAALSRLNQAVFARLSGDEAITLDGAPITAIFDNGYSLASVGVPGMASTQPALAMQTTAVPSSPVGLAATVGAVAYVVAAHEPDGTGASRLLLELAT